MKNKPKKKYDNFNKLANAYAEVSIQCKCGHKSVIPFWVDKVVCSWCGYYVYRNKKLEFKEKLSKKLKELK